MNFNFMGEMCGPIASGMCRLSMDGGIAIKTSSGYKTYNPATNNFVNCDNFAFDIGDEMFFVIPTNSVQVGDIILASHKPRYVMKVEDNMLTTLNYETGAVETILPEKHTFMGNTYFYGKIVSMFGNVGKMGGTGTENIIKYMMMSQMFKGMGGKSDMNPMMLAMMMGNGGGFFNMFDGVFGASTTDIPVKNSTLGKRADVGVLDEFADVKEEK